MRTRRRETRTRRPLTPSSKGSVRRNTDMVRTLRDNLLYGGSTYVLGTRCTNGSLFREYTWGLTPGSDSPYHYVVALEVEHETMGHGVCRSYGDLCRSVYYIYVVDIESRTWNLAMGTMDGQSCTWMPHPWIPTSRSVLGRRIENLLGSSSS